MRYKFKVTEDGKEGIEKEAMSFKKVLKSLVTPNPKWTGWIAYKNKITLMPLNYVNSDPFSSATMKVTKVKNNRKRVNDYEYIKVK